MSDSRLLDLLRSSNEPFWNRMRALAEHEELVAGGHYPIALLQDRYSGAFSGGLWLAIAGADLRALSWSPIQQAAGTGFAGETRVDWCLNSHRGPYGSELEAEEFWRHPPAWIAVGNTPDEAFLRLVRTEHLVHQD